MRPSDIASLITLGTPTLAPDGRVAVVAASRPDLEADEYRSRLWSVPLDGAGPPRPLTTGPNDSAPRFSPDGRWLAFLRKRDAVPGKPASGKPQLAVLPVDGGDARIVTELPGGAGAPVWSPDSRRVAFVARVPEPGRYGTDEKVPPDKEPPRRITTMRYRRDGVGWLVDRRAHVFVVDLGGLDDETGEADVQQVTESDYDDDGGLTWQPDGERLIFTSTRHERREHELTTDLFSVRPDGSDLRQITDSSLTLYTPTYAPGGALLALGYDSGPDRSRWVAVQSGLYRIDPETGTPTRLTDAEEHNLVDAPIAFDADGRALVLVENRGAVDLLAVDIEDATTSVVSEGHRMISGVDAAAGAVVVAYADETSRGELGVVREGVVEPRTEFGAALRPAVLPMTELLATAPDGATVHGWVVTPPGDGPHPTLLMIHGGPFAQYGWTVFDEAQVYARAGYAVVYGNPRGSSGYGAAYGQWILGDVGPRSAVDLFALLDAALSRPDLDGSRVGVLGGSHGGFMTTWLVGHSDRFFAAVSERAVNAIDSFEGSSDIGWGFGRDLWRPRDGDLGGSPLTYADQITTPLLIIHSEQDWRCPLEQAQRLFVALRQRRREVEMLVFPGEGHEMSRSGTPRHRVARFEAIVDWFDRHLPTGGR